MDGVTNFGQEFSRGSIEVVIRALDWLVQAAMKSSPQLILSRERGYCLHEFNHDVQNLHQP